MSFASKHRKCGIDWGVNTEGFEFKTREELYKASKDPESDVYTLRGFYINKKGKFGDHPVAICDDMFVDFPDYMLEEMLETAKDEEDVNDIKAGKVGFYITQFTDSKFGKTCYGIEWVDLVVE